MGKYSNKGLYNGYDKKNKERQAEDYYATPTEEVLNMLEQVGINFNGDTILEPCCGGGHMVDGILKYTEGAKIIATDIKERENKFIDEHKQKGVEYYYGSEYDIMSDDYPFDEADWVIMNPPYSIIEPFMIRTLEIAKKGVIMLGRIQVLEGEKRYTSVLKDNPPTDVYVYVDRIACYKNGKVLKKIDSAQMYAWFVWDKSEFGSPTRVYQIRRNDKK